jgi:transposase-like protein
MTAIFFNASRSIPDETTETQPLTVLQGEGGFGSPERREDDRELAAHYDLHANQITSWTTQLLENAAGIFGAGVVENATDRERIRELHAKIGELTVERDFLDSALGRFPGPSGRR